MYVCNVPGPCTMPSVEVLKSKMKSEALRRARRSTAVPASSSCCCRVRPLDCRAATLAGAACVLAVNAAARRRTEAWRYMMEEYTRRGKETMNDLQVSECRS